MKPTVPEVLPAVWALYERSAVGCCLHIVLDDGNEDDGAVQVCIDTAKERGHKECLELAETMMQMSRTQRRKLGARAFEKEREKR